MKKHIILLGGLFISSISYSQVGINTDTPKATLDVVGKPTVTTALDGIIAPRISGADLRAKTYTADQTGALVYVTAADTAPAGQTIDVTASGYYYFNGLKWVITSGADSNTDTSIYTVDGAIVGTAAPNNVRTLNLNGNRLEFAGTNNKTRWTNDGLYQINLQNTGSAFIELQGGDGATFGNMYLQHFVASGDAQILASGNTKRFSIGTNYTNEPSYLRFITTSAANEAGKGRMYINSIGNVSMGPSANEFATETLDVFGDALSGQQGGNVRIRQLPLNGATNAIFTTPSGTASATRNQTFTATRTIVADANGVLGYVNELPQAVETSKVIVNARVPGTQNLKNTIDPATVTGEFTNENIDTYSVWTSNEFTVPATMGGVYMLNMQNTNMHTVAGANTGWYIMAYFQKSTDGGTTWIELIRDTRSNLMASDADNGNSLHWTGSLNAGDKVRVRFNSSSNTDNIIIGGSVTITKLVY